MGADLKFIHCADLHLGSRFVGITTDNPVLGRKLTGSTFRSFSKIVDLALNEKVDLMVISGDVFDEENETPSTRFKFTEEMKRLEIPCFISLGNHDHKRSWEDSIPFPDNVHVFPTEAESVRIKVREEDVEITGISFPSRHTSNNLATSLKGSPNIFSIAVVHCDLDASSDENYAPCKTSDLLGRNIDYWALGHIHKRSEIYKNPHIVYPGNIQGRNTKESGEKGAYLVSVKNNIISDLEFVPTQDILWQDLTIDISGKGYDDIIGEIKSKAVKDSILMLHMIGKGEVDAPLRLDTRGFIDIVSTRTGCIVSSVDLRTSPLIDLDGMSKGNDLISMIIKSADGLSSMDRNRLIEEICSNAKTSAEIRWVFEEMNDDALRSMAVDAEMFLIERLTGATK